MNSGANDATKRPPETADPAVDLMTRWWCAMWKPIARPFGAVNVRIASG